MCREHLSTICVGQETRQIISHMTILKRLFRSNAEQCIGICLINVTKDSVKIKIPIEFL